MSIWAFLKQADDQPAPNFRLPTPEWNRVRSGKQPATYHTYKMRSMANAGPWRDTLSRFVHPLHQVSVNMTVPTGMPKQDVQRKWNNFVWRNRPENQQRAADEFAPVMNARDISDKKLLQPEMTPPRGPRLAPVDVWQRALDRRQQSNPQAEYEALIRNDPRLRPPEYQ